MPQLLIFILISLLVPALTGQPEKNLRLEDYVWKNRIVLLFADKNSDDLLNQQMSHLLEDQSGLEERDLLVFAFRNDAPIREIVHGRTFPVSEELKHKYWKPEQGFYAVLIGKDGGIKYESASLLQRAKLFAIIDAMPMRRAEISQIRSRH